MYDDLIAIVALNALGCAVGLLLLGQVISKSRVWLSASVMFSVPWVGNILSALLPSSAMEPPRSSTVVLLYVVWWLFLVGYSCGLGKGKQQSGKIDAVHGIRGTLVLASLVVLQGIAVQVEVLATGFDMKSFLKDIFYLAPALRVHGAHRAVEYFPTFSLWRWDHVFYVPLAFLLYSWRKIRVRTVSVVLLVGVVSCAIRFTRAPLFQLAIVGMVAWSVLLSPRRRTILLVGAGLVGLTIVTFIGSQSRILAFTRNSSVNIGDALPAYFGGSVFAFETILDGNYPRVANTYYTLEPLNYVLSKVGLNDQYAGVIRPQAEATIDTNIYTFLDAYTLDFGRTGALVGAALTGMLMGWLQRRVTRQCNYLNVTIYAYGCYCCAMAFANNEFLRFSFPFGIVLAMGIHGVLRRYTTNTPVAIRVATRARR